VWNGMRLGFLGVTLGLVSVVAVACGGNAVGAGDEGDAEPATAVESDGAQLGEGYVSHCDELLVAVKHYAVCTDQDAPPDTLEAIRKQCEQSTAQTPTHCASEFRELTRCQARELEACEGESLAACRSEELAFTECVSGGTCHDVGGASRGTRPGGLETFTTHLACQCLEPENQEDQQAAPEGTACDSPHDCPTTCCPCPLPNTEYSGAVCDKSATGGTGPGVCASAEAACAATASRCGGM
jgi:hypothetical protein